MSINQVPKKTHPEQGAKGPVEEKLVDYSEHHTYDHNYGLALARCTNGMACVICISNEEEQSDKA